MGQPGTIIYSDGLYADLFREAGKAAGRVKRLEESIHTGPLRRISDGAEIASRRETVTKVRVGTLADVAPMGCAYGSDMAEYGTIIFDLDFELETPAIRRIVELNMEVTGDGDYRTPHTWSSIAAKPHIVLLVLARSKGQPTGTQMGQQHVCMSSPTGIRFVKTNYDLLDRLSLKFKTFDPAPETAGRVLAPDNYKLDLKKSEAASIERWIKLGTAFRFADHRSAPPALRQASFCHVRSGADTFTIAGAFRFEKSLVGFLPATDLKALSWIKTATEITDFLRKWSKSPQRLSSMADSGLLEKVWIIVRPAPSARSKGTIEVTLKVGSKSQNMTIPPRGKGTRGGSQFNREHLRVIEFGKVNGLVELKEAINFDRAVASQAMNALRAGARLALEKVGGPVELAERLFPAGYVGITNRIPRDQIVIDGVFSE
jgi:hypothetical protein